MIADHTVETVTIREVYVSKKNYARIRKFLKYLWIEPRLALTGRIKTVTGRRFPDYTCGICVKLKHSAKATDVEAGIRPGSGLLQGKVKIINSQAELNII